MKRVMVVILLILSLSLPHCGGKGASVYEWRNGVWVKESGEGPEVVYPDTVKEEKR